jgi:pyrimidine-nucleoside phosphorylase
MKLGGGRETLDDVIDMSAGIILSKKIGDFVKKGEVLCTLHTNKSEDEYKPIIEDVKKAYVIVKEKVEPRPVIKEIIENDKSKLQNQESIVLLYDLRVNIPNNCLKAI